MGGGGISLVCESTPSLPSGLYGYNNIHGTWPLTVVIQTSNTRNLHMDKCGLMVQFMQALAPLLGQDPRSGPMARYIVVLFTQVVTPLFWVRIPDLDPPHM